MLKIPTETIGSISFRTFTPEEVLKLSVLEITTPQNFNSLGHAISGGVYDPALGAVTHDSVCKTCNQNYVHCTGHLGHINLPLPVFNPLFLHTVHYLLRGSCFGCHRWLIPIQNSTLLNAQLIALKYGLESLVQDLEDRVINLLDKDDVSSVTEVNQKLDETLKTALSEIKDLSKAKQGLDSQNIYKCRHKLISQYNERNFSKPISQCPVCNAKQGRIYLIENNRFVISYGKSSNIKPKNKIKKKQKEIGNELIDVPEEVIVDEEEVAELLKETSRAGTTILTPADARKHLNALWTNEKQFLKNIYPILADSNSPTPMDTFFIDVLPVPPPRFRPINVMGDSKYENPQSLMLNKVSESCLVVDTILRIIKKELSEDELSDSIKFFFSKTPGKTITDKLQNAWQYLQIRINAVLDSDMNKNLTNEKTGVGVKQLLEKKSGIFRMNMMGKRVNYAARSVICPDPYINIDEIGIPDVFATKLTFPQTVTPFNVVELRRAVINGPYKYPGATMIRNCDGTLLRLSSNENQRIAMAKMLMTPMSGLRKHLQMPKEVHRHLVDGDMVLVNRQPTLHKPSIMAHKVKILHGERTLRLHYSNCKTYNADFDGDEMNIHLPQTHVGQAEAKMIANVTNQYLVPKDGTPLGGLIQDHMISGVHMTMRGTFFDRSSYQQLVYKALYTMPRMITTIPPCIWKPKPLWSGKQVISTVLINLIPKEKSRISLSGVAKISVKNWQSEPERIWLAGGTKLTGINMSESEVIFRQGELLCGVLDKAHYGPTQYGLIHCCYELYGGEVSSTMLSALGRLFNGFVQMRGFSLSAEDLLVRSKADRKRLKEIEKASKVGYEVAAEALGVKDSEDEEVIRNKMQDAHLRSDDQNMKMLDMCMKSKTDNLNNTINKIIMPNGLLKKFPENNLQMMVLSGAKGTSVNSMQMSCLLGQIELEGRRPPIMPSGRSLPSFAPYDASPRAGGFVGDRFVTGIRPQEYFFHCMAGREGLVDTAVKTSRSGYLQRCLIKHLEGLKVNYDMTVRDSDGSVIQFLYGEDGLDVQKATFLNEEQISFLVENYAAFFDNEELSKIEKFSAGEEVDEFKKLIAKWKKKNSSVKGTRRSPFLNFSKEMSEVSRAEMVNIWKHLNENKKEKYSKKCKKCPDPIISRYFPNVQLGAIVEKFEDVIDHYLSTNGSKFVSKADPAAKRIKKQKRNINEPLTKELFRRIMYLKAMHSICEPGEAVGLLAAQSIGEPSTQMTLNTFHFAGRGEMNVTLGIPRMNEILKTASKVIATPSMDIPFLPSAMKKSDEVKRQLTRLTLDQVVESINVYETIKSAGNMRKLLCRIRLDFLSKRHFKSKYWITLGKILNRVEHVFVKKLISLLRKKSKVLGDARWVTSGSKITRLSKNDAEEKEEKDNTKKKDEESDNEVEEGDGDARESRLKAKHDDENEYDEDEDELEGEKKDYSEDEYEFDNEEENLRESSNEDSENEDDGKISLKQWKRHKHLEKHKEKRINFVVNSHASIVDYKFDTEKERWCEITLELVMDQGRVDFTCLAQEAVKMTVLNEVKSIKRAFVSESNNDLILKTDGVNIPHMFQYDQILDLNRLYSNDIYTIAQIYGIEAAAKAITKEVQQVFKVYGIHVDPRHLSLIADYMTFDGTYRPLNRFGLQNSVSPLQQMSFETTMQFLKSSMLEGNKDELSSPSAQLIVGNQITTGTGSFDLRVKLC